MDLEDVVRTPGANNDAGVGARHYYTRIQDLATIPTVPAAPLTFEEKVTITDDFIFNTGKNWNVVPCTLEKGSIVSTQAGERDSHSYENMAKLTFPGNTGNAIGFLEEVKNDELIFLIVETDGQVRVVGSENLPAHVEAAETNTGESISDYKGNTITVKSIGRIAPVYTGLINLVAAV